MKTTKLPNRLANSASPYLLQHAFNPVDWYPWGGEAFAEARSRKIPIFLSIGYAACHWCHVMERESFENEAVAEFLNQNFVAIKVDREERPDVDEIYMTAVQMMTGSGGWPLSVFLNSDLKPFYGGTYYPPEDRYGRPGFLRLLQMIKTVWSERPGEVSKAAVELMEALEHNSRSFPGSAGIPVDINGVDRAARLTAETFDPFRGGFGGAPKFPPTGQMDLLLRVWKRTGNNEYKEMVERTLQRMTAGGIFDQLGGGFARYSTDVDWLVPHFEKMLYDNALLACSLIDCGQATRKPEYFDTAQRTLDWMLSEMRDDAGGFHSSLDADSEGIEGKFYVWNPREIHDVLGNEDGELFCEMFDVSESGNFEHGQSILHVAVPLQEMAIRHKISGTGLSGRLDSSRLKLLEFRRNRIPPAKDDKVLTDWNSLAIIALAKYYRVSGDNRYLLAAQEAAEFIHANMWLEDKLMHSWRNGKIGSAGLLDDYAYYLLALTELYMADFDKCHLAEARRVAERVIAEFWDGNQGGFYSTPADREDLIIRIKNGHDGATPSGNAMAASALYRLAQIWDRDDLKEIAEKIVKSFSDIMQNNPTAHLRLYSVLETFISPSLQVAIIGDKSVKLVQNLLYIVNREYSPDTVVVASSTGDEEIALSKDRTQIDGKPTVYVCRDSVCALPVTDTAALELLLTNQI